MVVSWNIVLNYLDLTLRWELSFFFFLLSSLGLVSLIRYPRTIRVQSSYILCYNRIRRSSHDYPADDASPTMLAEPYSVDDSESIEDKTAMRVARGSNPSGL